MPHSVLDSTVCPRCSARVPRGPRYCGECGADLVSGANGEPEPETPSSPARRRNLARPAQVAGGVMLAATFVLALLAYTGQRGLSHGERDAWQAAVGDLEGKIDDIQAGLTAVSGSNAKLRGQIKSTEKKISQADKGVAPLAKRALRSVFTVETKAGLGAGFAAWTDNGIIYVITANHVVEDAGSPFVDVKRNNGSWSGQIVANDRANDLALIRLSGRPAGAEPLWQRARGNTPGTGDQLLLIGSPYGLAGTVTTGVVSRVTKRVIQTDAAANPGNSGGPAIDRQGRIVGVLVAGGGQNLNFAVPIARACVKLRRC
jgi:S1-C subfamily serine protease